MKRKISPEIKENTRLSLRIGLFACILINYLFYFVKRAHERKHRVKDLCAGRTKYSVIGGESEGVEGFVYNLAQAATNNRNYSF